MPTRTTQELLRQFHHNQTTWIARLASGQMTPRLPDPRVAEFDETAAMRPGGSGVIMLPMQGELDSILADHEQAWQWLRLAHVRDVLTWAMQPDPVLDLEMLALGYTIGFEPWWMTRDLTAPISAPQHTVRPIREPDIEPLAASDVPYVVRDQIPAMRALIDSSPREVHWLVASIGTDLVGHAIINITGEHAGLFNVGVHGRYRRRGIGTSLTVAAMQLARDHGAHTMNLNSTADGKNMYLRAGFQPFGTGQTWVRSGYQIQQHPSPTESAWVRAIGSGTLESVPTDLLITPRFGCGLSPQELASRFGQQEVLRRLLAAGLVPDIIALWRAGMREEALAATHDPQARELITGSHRAHPIHHAIEMGAGTLVMALIAAHANLDARDGEYEATPLDWAHACNKPTIARLIRLAGGR